MLISQRQYNKLPIRLQGYFEPMRNTHPTVKTLSLMRYLCRLITPPDGLVLDCFAGSGSTLIGAMLEGFKAVGIEQSPEYVEIAIRRLRFWKSKV